VPVKILSVIPKSPCAKKGIKAGDILISINGNPINDILDFQFYVNEKDPVVEINSNGNRQDIFLKKGEYQDMGLIFETYLMDSQRCCSNNCIFCFIDQLPAGLRESLYFKDDDSRLSFLFGNYITLTNLNEPEVERIIEMHISPVNISVHTMNPALRIQMMKNTKAGECLKYIKRFADAGIKINTQLVLCPGINDGEELKFSLEELGKMVPAVQSIAAVPVGLTCHREGLRELEAYKKETAGQVIDIIDDFNIHFNGDNNPKTAFPADEFYLKAEREMPGAESYGDFPQFENGVGMWALLKDEFYQILNDEEMLNEAFEKGFCLDNRQISVATGEAAYPLIKELVDETVKKWHNLKVNIVKIKNNFFGESITVAGLLTGKDFLEQLANENLGSELLIPAVTLRHEGDMFLDDVTLDELSEKLKIKIIPVPNKGKDFIQAILGRQA